MRLTVARAPDARGEPAPPPALPVLADAEWLSPDELEAASPFRLLEPEERLRASSPLATGLGHYGQAPPEGGEAEPRARVRSFERAPDGDARADAAETTPAPSETGEFARLNQLVTDFGLPLKLLGAHFKWEPTLLQAELDSYAHAGVQTAAPAEPPGADEWCGADVPRSNSGKLIELDDETAETVSLGSGGSISPAHRGEPLARARIDALIGDSRLETERSAAAEAVSRQSDRCNEGARPAPAVAASDAPAHADVLRADGGSSAGTGAGDNAERDLANARAADGSGVSVFAFSTLAKRRARRSSDSETTRATTADAGPPQEDALTRSNPASPTVAFELPACVAPAPPPCAGKIQVNSLRRCDHNPVAFHRVTALRARFSKRTICSRGAPFDNNTNCTLIATQPQPACAASSSCSRLRAQRPLNVPHSALPPSRPRL